MDRSRAWTLGALVVALAVLAGVLAFVLLNQGGEPSASPTPTLAESQTPHTTPSPTLNQALLDERLTVLVIGLDTTAQRRAQGLGLNTDTLMLASVAPDQSDVTLISLPRDTVDIPLPDGGTWQRKVNALYAERGVEALVGAMEELFGVPIDGYAQIDMDDFPALVDAAGGVEVSPQEPLSDPIVDLDLPAGEQMLDGTTALAYVRTRVDTDYGRMARQQEVLLDLVRRLASSQTDVDVRRLLDGLASFETSLPLDDLPTLLEIARRASEATVEGTVLRPPDFIVSEGDIGDGRGYILIPDVEAIRQYATEAIGEG
ncbi:MAG TPA: LCP family protein [candidate division Zixibacteria bacterium]|nr:LCP family protein [candidate division Zixibacteria bacterium]